MAHIVITKYEDDFAWNRGAGSLKSHEGDKAVYVDRKGDMIVVHGHDFKYAGDSITSGTITSIDLKSPEGKVGMHMTEAELDANTVIQPLVDRDFIRFYHQLFIEDDYITAGPGARLVIKGAEGDDVIIGGDRADTMYGALGHDTMTGNGGSDYFFFKSGDGQDVITDFDALGGGNRQDYITTDTKPIDIRNDHGDTVIDFGHGDTLTLLDVKASDVTFAKDFDDY